MTADTELVSVIIPAHNCMDFIGDTIESILAQTHAELEIIICDDASTDDTWSVLKEYQSRDKRIVLIQNENNKGPSFTRNRCIQLANSEYVALSDSDDLSAPNRIEKQYMYLKAHDNLVLLGTNMTVCDESMKEIKQSNFPTSDAGIRGVFARYFPFVGPSAMFRKSLFLETNGYLEGHRIAHDYLLYLELSALGEIANLSDALYYYRLRPSSITGKNISEAHLGSVQVGMTAHLIYKCPANWLTKIIWVGRIVIPPLIPTRLMRRISLWFTR